MNQFTFVRDGKSYTLSGPPGSTEEQALAIFEAQQASGTLVGQPQGSVINLAKQVAGGLSPELAKAVSLAQGIGFKLPELKNVPIINGVTVSDVVRQSVSPEKLGTLNETQVQSLMAQAAAEVDQNFDIISQDKGVGLYGFDASDLEVTGYVKPGTAEQVAQDPANVVSILSSPSTWTGQNNTPNLETFLSAPNIQTEVQQKLMKDNLNQMTNLGVLTGFESAQELGSVINSSVKYGVNTAVDWIKGLAPSNVVSEINNTAKLGEYAVNFANSTLGQAADPAKSLINGLRSLTDSISGAGLSSINLSSLSSIPGLSNLSSINLGGLTSGLSNLGSLIPTGGSQISSLIGGLGGEGGIQNALTAIGGGQVGGALSSLSGQFGSIFGNVSGELSGVTKALGSLGGDVSKALTGIQGDLTGKLTEISDSIKGSIGDLFGSGGSISGFEIGDTTLGALGSEFSASIGQLGADITSAFGAGGELSGLLGGAGGALGAIGPVAGVFTSFFGGGGGGDSAGLNFSLSSIPKAIDNFTNTFNRSTLDGAVNRIVGNGKISLPEFGGSSTVGSAPKKVDADAVVTMKQFVNTVSVATVREQQNTVFGSA